LSSRTQHAERLQQPEHDSDYHDDVQDGLELGIHRELDAEINAYDASWGGGGSGEQMGGGSGIPGRY
jgi:hypothetical protein